MALRLRPIIADELVPLVADIALSARSSPTSRVRTGAVEVAIMKGRLRAVVPSPSPAFREALSLQRAVVRILPREGLVREWAFGDVRLSHSKDDRGRLVVEGEISDVRLWEGGRAQGRVIGDV
ncbi:hypothetical protein [Aureimonas mangrovi]|uniref:hypothetical protein n=1 Tax=Aureimonas mangrovi TaxID=2758041 RepID=UPI00163D962A|nr:hypothetical protein [Aureimonas mangrovi]